jgi:HlyD family secretion protein
MAKRITRSKMASTSLALSGNSSHDEAVSSTAILEFQSPTLTLISAPAPFSARMTLWLISSFVILSLTLFATVPIDRVVSAPGVLLAETPNPIVQPLETAIVRKIYVKDGDFVKKGDLLAELDPTFAASDRTATTAQLASLKAQVDRLKAELADKPYLSDGSQYGQLEELAYLQRHQQLSFAMEDYNQKINSLQAKVNAAKGDVDSFNKRLVGLKEVESMRKELEKFQVGSKLNTLAAVDQRQQVQGQLEDAKNALDGANRDLASMMAERDAYKHQWYVDTQTLEGTQERSLSDMSAQASKNQLRANLVRMTAPEDSVVLSVARVAPGTVLQSGTQLMTTVPVDAPLQVVSPIDGSDIGFVSVGNKVAIKFDTLPYFRYGYATGHVVKLSNDSFTDPTAGDGNPTGQQPTISPQSPGNTGTAPVYYYRATIAIDKLELRHTPPSFRLMPGMPLTADIRVGQRTIIQYIFDKFVPFLSRGMREPT